MTNQDDTSTMSKLNLSPRHAVDLALSAAILVTGFWIFEQPSVQSHADRYVCDLFWATWKPLWIVAAALLVGAALAPFVLRDRPDLRRGPRLLLLGGLVATLAFAAKGHAGAAQLCRYQKRNLATKLAAKDDSPAEKRRAENRQELVKQAAEALTHPESARMPLEGAKAVVSTYQKDLQGALAEGAERLIKQGTAPLLGSPGAPPASEPFVPPAIKPGLEDPPAESVPSGGGMTRGPALGPTPPPPGQRSPGLPPEAMAALFVGCLAAGVSAPLCIVGAEVLGGVFKTRGADISNEGYLKLAGALAGVLAGEGDPSYVPPIAPDQLDSAARDELRSLAENPALRAQLPQEVLNRVREQLQAAAAAISDELQAEIQAELKKHLDAAGGFIGHTRDEFVTWCTVKSIDRAACACVVNNPRTWVAQCLSSR